MKHTINSDILILLIRPVHRIYPALNFKSEVRSSWEHSDKIRVLYPNYTRIIYFFGNAEPNAELFGWLNFDRIKPE